MAACPICGKTAPPRPKNPMSPFCCTRCRQIDLGKWLSEEYRVPTNETPEHAADSAEEAKS